MNLTNRERKTLLAYQKHRKKPPTISQLWRPVIPRFVLLALLTVVAYFFASEWAWIFFAGTFAGAFLRELSFIRYAYKFGPILYAIIDWDMIDELLETPTDGKAQHA